MIKNPHFGPADPHRRVVQLVMETGRAAALLAADETLLRLIGRARIW